METPVLMDLENILKEKNISAAAYHGGKLNGVVCREILSISNTIFDFEIKPYLCSIQNPGRCAENKINDACILHRDIFATLDALTSIFRMRNGEPNEAHYAAAEKHLQNLFKLWSATNLNFTPKIHSILVHALEQVRFFHGIGDTLEDDIEHMHQISARIESRVSHMKNKDQQAYVHSRMESIQSNVAVVTKIEEEIKMQSIR
jgi:hypothetical protein